jgi:N-acetylneuraminate synthase
MARRRLVKPKTIAVGERAVGPGAPTFIIAEAGVNHNGSVELAKRLVDAAAEAGADAVKFQTFKAEKLVAPHATKADYQKEAVRPRESQLEMLRRLELSPDAFRELKEYCDRKGMLFLSTPFDDDSVDLLNQLGVPVFKIASGDVVNHTFLEHIARKGKPMILSTGMCYLSEVDEATRVIRHAGNEELVLLHCVSTYPTPPSDVNLRAMQTLATAFGTPVGFSDHTLGIGISLAAVALGACVLEKHFTLDRQLPGPDHRASLEPDELKQFVESVRMVESALGSGRKEPAPSEADTAAAARRSLVAASDIPKQAVLTDQMIAVRRPGTGLPPSMQPFLKGRRTRRAIAAGTILTLEMLE